MAYESILTPGRLGGLEIRSRITMSPMEKNWGDRRGNPTHRHIDYYARRAEHGVGMMNFEATFIDERGRGNPFQMGLATDENIPAHRKLNEAVHAHGCKTSAELNHGGRNSDMRRTGLQPVAPSNIPCEIAGGHQLHVLSKEEIAGIVQAFRDGARRAIEAGYDIINIHGAHGYLIANFLSRVFNQRNDEYGGSDENRWRFLTEVYQAIRDEVGAGVPVGVRLSAEEGVEGGYRVDHTAALVNRLASLGLDFVDVSAGVYESFETMIPPMDVPTGFLLPLAQQIKSAVSIPVIAAGRINDVDLAERAISSGNCDFVHMSRAFHADPMILTKTVTGRKGDVVGCIACNKCLQQLFVGLPSACTVNSEVGREGLVARSAASPRRRVLVAGGGLAGMEAARVAAERGHSVKLVEKTDRLGGWLNVLRAPRNRVTWGKAIDDRARLCTSAGVEIVLDAVVDIDLVAREEPDVLIVATGTRPLVPNHMPGSDSPMVTNYDDITRGKVAIGRKAVVVGGQNLGLATAEFMIEQGANVFVIEPSDALASDMEYVARKLLLIRLKRNERFAAHLNTSVERIEDGQVAIQTHGQQELIGEVDQVVFAVERVMNRDLIEAIARGSLKGIEYFAVGDCTWPGEPAEAVLAGNKIGHAI